MPPSACSTSQSRVIVLSPILPMSTAARSERPISRWISCVRPPTRPWIASRVPRSWVERGNIEYSAVIQPWPLPRRCGGTRSSTLAVIQTRVRPISIRHEPSACTLTPELDLQWTQLVRLPAVGPRVLGHRFINLRINAVPSKKM